jgi:predicted nucleic acid-binding Zn ribbon protein
MGEEPPAGCETCGVGPLERVLYPVAVHFKGSGFYTTDYGRGSRKQAKETEGGGQTDSSSDSSGADKTEKPVEKTPAEKKAAEG